MKTVRRCTYRGSVEVDNRRYFAMVLADFHGQTVQVQAGEQSAEVFDSDGTWICTALVDTPRVGKFPS